MNRRSFIQKSSLATAGLYFVDSLQGQVMATFSKDTDLGKTDDLYKLFQNPPSQYRPFVRWWWNGNKVNKTELFRELQLLKEVGVGGVEINPISFPSRTDSMGIPSLHWLDKEWITRVQETCTEAKRKDMTCDLIVGSGWPFGSEELTEEESAQVVLVLALPVEGPQVFTSNKYSIFQAVDPQVTDKNSLRSPHLIDLRLAKDPLNSLTDVVDCSDQLTNDLIKIEVPEGPHFIYAVVQFKAFAKVINGAPGASGSILDHLNKQTVENYLNRMSATMQQQIGSLSQYIRALFTDSMELEGCNWCEDFPEEFQKRCGYDLRPYLPFILFKVGRLGAVVEENYGAKKSADFLDILEKVRFDFEFVKARLLYERFTQVYLNWCKSLQVKSRAQAYGRGFFPLETSLNYDIPEGESWTTNYLRHKLGEEMSDEDYRRGRGYTMINKYVSSAAHLKGNRLVSCEEMTNTYLVFNETLELLKLGSDQSIMSGTTHSIWHGFNYSPADASFPGWVQYGSFYNEKNNWWPYFKKLNDYKARLSSQLQNGDYYTDIAILPPNYDLWAKHGVQTDPFPEKLNVPYTSLLWEAINKNGGAADYITDWILSDASIKDGKIVYGPKRYSTLFLPSVESISEVAMQKIALFVKTGGTVICIDKLPSKGLGFMNWKQKNASIQQQVQLLSANYSTRFVLVDKPADNKFLEWYKPLIAKYKLPTYLDIATPNRYFMQIRSQRDDKSDLFFFQNAHRFQEYEAHIRFPDHHLKGKHAWVWDLNSGNRYRLKLTKEGHFQHNFGPTESLIIVVDKQKNGDNWKPLKNTGPGLQDLSKDWDIELRYSLESTVKELKIAKLIDMKDDESMVNFSGTAIYRKSFNWDTKEGCTLNLGKVFGVTEVFLNGQSLGVTWYGRRLYNLDSYLKDGDNKLEIHLITTMGNYMKTLVTNDIAQHWVNRKGREQEMQSMGIVGPLEIYSSL
ncbi:glycoside hydrolase family 2 [Sphingobacteriaceae bacterium WQ 2009]|uniref:Glycoside hydrolase family 2 n=1 Tax=Rhinopithecimicrobium faecis TaxID=2820698 RepID=A0A8T4H7P8_9SPHI|nr:glycoside hydrolase family 2 [Sphingobacteriaceae bacterium WQ 2009]